MGRKGEAPDTGQDLESVVEQEAPVITQTMTSEITYEQARELVDRLVRRSPKYKTLTPEGKKRLAVSVRKNPAMYQRLEDQIPELSEHDIQAQLENYRTQLVEAEKLLSEIWTPGEARTHYTPEEAKKLRVKQFIDTYVGWIVGNEHAKRYEGELLPLVRERFKTHTLTEVSKATGELEGLAKRVEESYQTTIDTLADCKLTAEQQEQHIELAEGMLVEIAAEISEVQQKLSSMANLGTPEYGVARNQLRELQGEARTYRTARKDAATEILVTERKMNRARYQLLQIAPMIDKIYDFAGDMKLISESIKLYASDQFEMVTPQTFQRLSSVYESAKQTLQRLDVAFEKTARAVGDAIPGQLATKYKTGNGNGLDGYATSEQSFLERQNRRVDDAKRAAAAMKQVAIPF